EQHHVRAVLLHQFHAAGRFANGRHHPDAATLQQSLEAHPEQRMIVDQQNVHGRRRTTDPAAGAAAPPLKRTMIRVPSFTSLSTLISPPMMAARSCMIDKPK